MKILIVENEKPAAEKLVRMLGKLDKTILVAGILETVEGVINHFQNESVPDLIFMDIQLDDGLCFEIFEAITIDTPIIFTTAYDEYTLKAFKVNSVDYLLKPLDEESLKSSLEKYNKHYTEKRTSNTDFKKFFDEFRNQYRSRFLIKIGEKFKSVSVGDISYFHISERSVFLRDFGGKDYGVDFSLEQIQSFLDPNKFYRINRDCIINIDAISQMYSLSSSRLQLTLRNEVKKEEDGDLFIVSRDRVSLFKKWIDR